MITNNRGRKTYGKAGDGMSLREELIRYIRKKYDVKPGYNSRGDADIQVCRHEDNGEHFAVFMKVKAGLMQAAGEAEAAEGAAADELTDAVSVKLDDPMIVDAMIQQAGYCRAYHVLQGNWLTAALDGTVTAAELRSLIDGSFLDTASAADRRKYRPPKEWIIPANPKYFDIVHAFDDKKIINWKQGAGIKAGATVYMYVAAPVSAILYRCKVLETDIPYEHPGHRLNITALMRIRLQKRYRPTKFTFEKLNKDYEIFAVRGPRGIPRALSEALRK